MIAINALEKIEMKREFPDMVKQHAMHNGMRIIDMAIEDRVNMNIHISEMSGKLDGLYAMSTTCVCNRNCLEMMRIPGTPCYYCFAAATALTYNALREWLENNHMILNSRLLNESEIRVLCLSLQKSFAGKVRIEFAGDVDTVLQCINYTNIMNIGKEYGLSFGVWTKLPNVWDQCIRDYGKCDNATYILSASSLNQTEIPLMNEYEWLDACFIVCNASEYDSVKAVFESRNIPVFDCKCENGSCANDDICGVCYNGKVRKRNNSGKYSVILEVLRK